MGFINQEALKVSKTFLIYGNMNDVFVGQDMVKRNFEQYLVCYLKEQGFKHVIFFGEDGTKGAYCLEKDSSLFFFGNETKFVDKRMDLKHFSKKILPLMLDKESRMAVIFYNIFTTDLGQEQALRNYVMDVWEKRDMNNCCIFMAPDTLYDQNSLVQYIRSMNLQSKFLINTDSQQPTFNPLVCYRVGFPFEDEIKSYIHRLSVIGTEKKRIRVAIKYNELDEVAAEILACSRSGRNEESKVQELRFESMRQIINRLETYIEAHAKSGEFYPITTKVIDDMYKIPYKEEKAPLKRLERPGWENVYNVMKRLYDETENLEKKDARLEQSVFDGSYDLLRLGKSVCQSKVRRQVPNFVILGNPGTGKGTTARMVGDILRDLGFLKYGHTVSVTRNDLTSSYIAGVPKATMACVESAEEGVLFIDEAHALGKKDGGANHEGTGQEVVSTLCGAMTDPSRHFSVVLAGYEEDMKAVFDLDDGFTRRFDGNFIVIEDYKPELLKVVLLEKLREDGYEIDLALLEELPDAPNSAPLDCVIKKIYDERNRKKFGNADEMIKLAAYLEGNSTNKKISQETFYGRNGMDETWFVPKDIKNRLENILQELQENYVGMEEFQQLLEDVSNEVMDQIQNGKNPADVIVRSMILVGNPGTGKSTIEKMIARLLFSLGVLGTPEPLRVHASELASGYQGGSIEKVNKLIKKAQELRGLIAIDEAHNLATGHFDGKGAMRAFMDPLTDTGKPIVCAFAVYPAELTAFKKLDPGSERRFQEINLPDYTGEQLYQILEKMAKKAGYSIAEDAEIALKSICNDIYENRTASTGNAGKMERILEDLNKQRRRRCKADGIPFESDAAKIFIIEDVLNANIK